MLIERQTITYGLLVASCGLNILLGLRLGSLREDKGMLTSWALLRPGEVVPPIDARAFDGRLARIDPKEGPVPTILYVWDPDCGWCVRNQANVVALARQTRGCYRLVSISLSRQAPVDSSWLEEFAGLVYHAPTEATKRAYSLGGVPQTIVISQAGTVEKLWRGAYVEEVRREVENYFGIRLPGIE